MRRRKLTKEQMAEMRRVVSAGEMSITRAARHWGVAVSTAAAIVSETQRPALYDPWADDETTHYKPPAVAAPETQERSCMCCGAPFASEGIHHRLCWPCRTEGSPFAV